MITGKVHPTRPIHRSQALLLPLQVSLEIGACDGSSAKPELGGQEAWLFGAVGPQTRKLVRFPLNHALLEHARWAAGHHGYHGPGRPAASCPEGSHDCRARCLCYPLRQPCRLGQGKPRPTGHRHDRAGDHRPDRPSRNLLAPSRRTRTRNRYPSYGRQTHARLGGHRGLKPGRAFRDGRQHAALGCPCPRDPSRRGWLCHQVHVDDFKPEADDPLYKPGEGSLVGQLGAKGGRLRVYGHLAVVELRAQRSAGRAAETDLIGEWTHLDYASQSMIYGDVSVSGGHGRRRHPESGDPIAGPDGAAQRAGRATVCPDLRHMSRACTMSIRWSWSSRLA